MSRRATPVSLYVNDHMLSYIERSRAHLRLASTLPGALTDLIRLSLARYCEEVPPEVARALDASTTTAVAAALRQLAALGDQRADLLTQLRAVEAEQNRIMAQLVPAANALEADHQALARVAHNIVAMTPRVAPPGSPPPETAPA